VEAVLDAAEEEKEALAGAGPSAEGSGATNDSFSADELKKYFAQNIEQLNRSAAKLSARQPELPARLQDASAKLTEMLPLLDTPAKLDLEDLERRLTICEERLSAALSASASDESLLDIRRDLDRQLAPYRRKMTAAQLSDLERRYTQKRLFESAGVPRLSLFYLS
jgi:hypothetical protein